jgi:folate-binding protein YgfZ
MIDDAQMRAQVLAAQAALRDARLLLTRLSPEKLDALPNARRGAIDYCAVSRTGFFGAARPVERKGDFAIVAAGTSDLPVAREAWRALDVAAGLPQVYLATSEAFVAQMLNLDVLGGIAFDKGCYTGQEVIARAHYRGRVKRRLQRFRTAAAAGASTALVPGSRGLLADGRAYTVVEAVRLADGRCEFLAVAPLVGAADDAEPAPRGEPAAALACEALALPYALPA